MYVCRLVEYINTPMIELVPNTPEKIVNGSKNCRCHDFYVLTCNNIKYNDEIPNMSQIAQSFLWKPKPSRIK